MMDIVPPFTEQEKRFVIAEAIRTSSIPIEKLLGVLQEGNVVSPTWEEMQIPYGRTVKMCMDMFNNLRSSQRYPYSGISTTASISTPSKRKSIADPFEYPMTSPPPKWRQLENVPAGRQIQPKASNDASPIPLSSIFPTQGKKRGRPSKADVERRQGEAMLRGEVIPPPNITLKAGQQLGESGLSTYLQIAPTLTALPLSPDATIHKQNPRELTTKEAAEVAIGYSLGRINRSRAETPPPFLTPKEILQSVKGVGAAGGHMPISPTPILPQLQNSSAFTAEKILDLTLDESLGKKRERRAPKSVKTPKPGESSFGVHLSSAQPRPIDTVFTDSRLRNFSEPSQRGGTVVPDVPSTSSVAATPRPIVNHLDGNTRGERRLRVSPRLNKGIRRGGKLETNSPREKENDGKLSIASDEQRRVSSGYKNQERVTETISEPISKSEDFGGESSSPHLVSIIGNEAHPQSESLTSSGHSMESEDTTDWEVSSDEEHPILSTTSREMSNLQKERENRSLIRQKLTPAKIQLVDRLMEYFWIIFNKDWKVSSRQRVQTSSQATGSYVANSVTTSGGTKGRKRSLDRGDDHDPGDEDGRGSKRFGSALEPPDISNNAENYACPYRKHNPRKYCVKDWRSCCLTPQKTIARVKGHLYRHHRINSCQRCKRCFETEEELDVHIEAVEACESRMSEIVEGITKKMEEKIRSRKSDHPGETQAEKWVHIYKILFPGDEEIPSPYFDPVRESEEEYLQCSDPTEIADYENFLRRVLPQEVRNDLDFWVNNEAEPLEENLKEQILGIIENAQLRTFLIYRNAKASNRGIKPDSATRKPASSESMTGDNVPNLLRDTAFYPLAAQSDYIPGRKLRHSTISQRNAQNNDIFDSSNPSRPDVHLNGDTSGAAQSQTNTYELPSFTSPDPNGLDAAMQHIGQDLSWPLPPYHEHNANQTPTSQEYRFDETTSLSDEHWNTLPTMGHLNSLNWNPLGEADIETQHVPGKEKDGFGLQIEQTPGSS